MEIEMFSLSGKLDDIWSWYLNLGESDSDVRVP